MFCLAHIININHPRSKWIHSTKPIATDLISESVQKKRKEKKTIAETTNPEKQQSISFAILRRKRSLHWQSSAAVVTSSPNPSPAHRTHAHRIAIAPLCSSSHLFSHFLRRADNNPSGEQNKKPDPGRRLAHILLGIIRKPGARLCQNAQNIMVSEMRREQSTALSFFVCPSRQLWTNE